MRRPGYLGDYDGIFDWFKPKKKKKETPPEVIAAKAPATESDSAASEPVARPEGCPPCPPCNAARADAAKAEPKKEKKPDEKKGWFRRWFS